jgi:hypothetical protein
MLHGCLLEELPTVAKAVGADSLLVAGVLMLFVVIASLTVMNLLVGILVEVVGVVAAVENEEITCNIVKTQMQTAINQLDGDADNRISQEEFNQILDRSDVIRGLKEIGVDVVALVSLSDVIFENGKSLNFPDFMEIVLQFRGSNVATVKDIVDLRKMVGIQIAKVEQLLMGRERQADDSPVKPRISPFESSTPLLRSKSKVSRFSRELVV